MVAVAPVRPTGSAPVSPTGSAPVRPTMDNVLIRPIVEEVSKGGIIMPESKSREDAIKRVNKGTVLAVGPGRHEAGVFVQTTLQPGAKVYYHCYPSGCTVLEGGEVLTLIAEKQVVGVVQDGEVARG